MSADENKGTPTEEVDAGELEDLEPQESDDSVTGGALKGAPMTLVNNTAIQP